MANQVNNLPTNLPSTNVQNISGPILYPDDELVDLNGFAWTQTCGIVVKSNNNPNQSSLEFLS